MLDAYMQLNRLTRRFSPIPRVGIALNNRVGGMCMASEQKQALGELRKVAFGTVTADFTDVQSLTKVYEAAIDAYMPVIERRDLITDNLADSPDCKAHRVERSLFWEAIGVMADRIDYVLENIERARQKEENSKRTRDEWEAIERRYLEETIGKTPVLPEGDGRWICAAWGCNKVFTPRPKRPTKYCCPKCSRNQKSAEQRLKDHGTYLPVKVYESYRDEYAGKQRAFTEVSMSAAYGCATDGREYRKRTRRKRTDREETYFHQKREREEQKRPGEVISYNLAEVAHNIDDRGRYFFGNEWQSAASSRNNFL